MVLGHSSLHNESLMNFITAFHVPVFFLISGFFEKGVERNLRTRVIKGFNQILIPFFFFNVIGLLSCWISPYLHPELYYNIHGFRIFTNAILGIFLMDDFVTPYSYLPVGPTWFLVSLFICKMLFGMLIEIYKLKRKIKFLFYVLFVFFVFMLYQPQIHFASFDSAAMGFPFYFLGFCLNRIEKFSTKISNYILIPVCAVLIAGLYFLSQKNGFVGIDGGNYGKNLFLFYLNAIIGSIMIICFSMILSIRRMKILSYIGENTLTILGVHISMLYVVKFIFVRLFHLDMNNLHTLFSIIMSVITLSLSLILVFVFNKYCPKLIGKQ